MTKSESGFTLLEVLIALTVATLGMLAVTLSTITASANASTLRERTLAHWVAMNVAAELRLSEEWPDVGTRDDTVEFANTDWVWTAEISETDVEALRRVRIGVAYAETEDDEVTHVIAFVGKPSRGQQFRDWAGVEPGPGVAPGLIPGRP